MSKKYIKAGLISAAAAVLISVCGCQNSAALPADTSVSQAAKENVTMSENTVSQDTQAPEKELSVTESSILSSGNTERLKKCFEKAENGEELTVAYIGGSITEGIAVKPDECWAKLSYDRLCEAYPKAAINYVNAGMSGTPSMLGIIRAERDVLAPHGDPDIVFIEFAVNDAQDSVSEKAYESLVRRMLSLSPDTAVILLFMRTDNGYSCQKHMSAAGYHYGLPMISVNDALSREIEAGRMTWADYSDDGAHPNIAGNRLVADMIEEYFDSVREGRIYEGKSEGWDKGFSDVSEVEPLYGDSFVNTHMLDRTNLTPVSLGEYNDQKETIAWFPNGWTRKGGENQGISFDIRCSSLFIVFHCNKVERYGTAEVFCDGEKVSEVKSYRSDGWNNPVPQLLFSDYELKTHRIEIKMKEGQEDTYFGILAFGYCD